jgi:hypothetical protein
MPDYSNGKIYKIIDESDDEIYVGSTVQELKTRFRTHGMFTTYKRDKQSCKIILIERYPCKSKRELETREQYWIDNIICINRLDAVMNIEKKKINYEKRMQDEHYRNKRNEYSNKYREYQKTWGGRTDLDNNSLLKIDPDLFRGSPIHPC